MKRINSFTKNAFSQWAIFQLFADLLHLIKTSENEPLKTFIEHVITAFEIAFNKYDSTLVAAKQVEAPTEFDEKRDWGIRELYSIASVYEDHFVDPDKQAAARFFLDIFNRYGTGPEIARLGQDKESGVLSNALQEFLGEAAKPHTTVLTAEKLLNFIDENNTGFMTARRALTEENMQLAGQVKEARMAAQERWDNLRDAINGFAIVNPDNADCAALIDSLNATIEHHKENLRRSKGRKTDEENPETPSEE